MTLCLLARPLSMVSNFTKTDYLLCLLQENQNKRENDLTKHMPYPCPENTTKFSFFTDDK